jgi:hypothetical protein
VKLFGVVVVAMVLLGGCGGGQGAQENNEDAEADGAKKKAPETGPPATPFEGEHTDLGDGDTATWNAGMAITVSDIHIATNENRRLAEENVAMGRGGEKSPALRGPEELIAFSWTITNEGETPINFSGRLPCTGLDVNGVELSGQGLTAEQMPNTGPKRTEEILKQPLEQGQTRSGIASMAVPDAGIAEWVCVQPPQQGGPVNVGVVPEQGKATWTLDPATLPRRN